MQKFQLDNLKINIQKIILDYYFKKIYIIRIFLLFFNSSKFFKI